MRTMTLDLPPSTNNLFATATAKNGKQIRVKSAKYKAWLKTALQQIKLVHRVKPIAGEVDVAVALIAEPKIRGDLDNRLKSILDALVTAGVIEDDCKVQRITAEWKEAGKPSAFVSIVQHVPRTPRPKRKEVPKGKLDLEHDFLNRPGG